LTVTVDQIRKAMAITARVIETEPYGEKVWPIFERLERELAVREDRDARLKAALAYDAAEAKKVKAAKKRRTVNPLYADIVASRDQSDG